MNARGTFEITMQAEPPYDVEGGVALGRATFDKRFSGALTAESRVQMLSCLDGARKAGAYVAMERIRGTLEGKTGSFVVAHLGERTEQSQSLTVLIAPGSGTGELAGIRGRMQIEIVEGQHFYEIDWHFEQ